MNKEEIEKECIEWEERYKWEKKEHFLTKIGMTLFFLLCIFFAYKLRTCGV